MSSSSLTTIAPPKFILNLRLDELWRSRELFYIFTWRDLKVRYKQTALGIAWVIFQPFISMVVFTTFFGRFFQESVGSVPYPVFVYLGLIFWNFFSQSLSGSSNSLVENESIIKKIYFPRLIIPLASTIAHLVDFFLAALVLGGLMVYFKITPALVGIALIPFYLVITFLTAVGVGLFLASINVRYRDVRYVVPFFIQLLLFLTPVIYPVTIIGDRFQLLFYANPMAAVIDNVRSSLLAGSVNWPALAIALGVSLLYFLLGLYYFRKTEDFFADIL